MKAEGIITVPSLSPAPSVCFWYAVYFVLSLCVGATDLIKLFAPSKFLYGAMVLFCKLVVNSFNSTICNEIYSLYRWNDT